MATRPAEPIVSTELDTIIKDAESFWHRARALINLPPDKFVGVNNIKTFLLGMKSYSELVDNTFDNLKIRKDGTWVTTDDS